MSYVYDDTNPISIEEYGKQMIGKTFRCISEHPVNTSILKVSENSVDYATNHARKSYKGGMGILVEECHFGYKANSDDNPDFPKAGVELKVVPYKKTKKGFSSKERLVLTMIDFFKVVNETSFEDSHVWHKSKLILLVWYLWMKEHSTLDLSINYVDLFTPPPNDLAIIKADYQKIVDKIKAGKAHELSEGDTLYLGACTKSSDSSIVRQQPFSDIPAKPRAFSLKNSYMTYVLNEYILKRKSTYETILTNPTNDFEGYITSKLLEYKDYSIGDLITLFNIGTNNKKLNKAVGATIVYRILGIKGNHAEEFVKANIKIKTIHVNSSGKIKENMSFPTFKFTELAEETWETSQFANELRNTKFFFVIFKDGIDGICKLDKCMFWNMPYDDLEIHVQSVWKKMHDIVANGNIQVHRTFEKSGKFHLSTNFPKQSDNPVSHVRPHATTREDRYPLPNGTKIISLDNEPMPWGDNVSYPKHCFWLNNSYILSQIKKG